ncbi:MAG: polyphosphate glucokinase [Opitutus sp.]|nr:polyphosphate glucokinase [Opitutus sp.]
MKVLGIDIGGSSFKAAPVDLRTGRLTGERFRVPVSSPCPRAEGLAAAKQIVGHFRWKGRVGIGFPGIVREGRIGIVGNLGAEWENQNGVRLFTGATGCRVGIANDADAAGLAEMRFGAGQGRAGTVLMFTFGTGIGSALFHRGQLFPNAELGHIPWAGQPIEQFASAAVKTKLDLDWAEWAGRVNVYLRVVERLFSPELIIVGGGVSQDHKAWFKLLRTQAKVVPAKLHNDAGIVGAALVGE